MSSNARLRERRASDPEYRIRNNAYQRQYRAEHPEFAARVRARRREWGRVHAAELAAKSAARFREQYADPEFRTKHLGRRRQAYTGFSPELFEATFELQGGLCALCGKLLAREGHGTHADHGPLGPRGILCNPCNTALGSYEKLVALGDVVQRYLLFPPAQIANIHR